ncbi:hypothetical protein, partial [Pseudomonas aeruginosa]|uniref:hypothetical protein n=1 Tax=Pseudomonas aeruginosa TaxID=287 RepID=UPI002237F806
MLDDPKEVLTGLDMSELYRWDNPILSALFILLARRIGVLDQPNPNDPSTVDRCHAPNGVDLKNQIESVIGSIRVPNGFRCPCTDHGVPTIHFLKVGQWFTIKSLMDPGPKRVLEIGAGTGGLGLVAFNNGVQDYT